MLISPIISLAQFSTFVPYQYKEQPTDFSTLERALKKKHAKMEAAYENLAKLKYILGDIKKQLNDDFYTQKWFSNYCDSLISDIENHIKKGNPSIASSIAESYILSVPMDQKVLRMIQISNEYNEVRKYVQTKYWKGEITSIALDCWLDNNPCWKDGSLPSDLLINGYHWQPTYIVSNSMNIDDLCNYIKNNTSKKEEYYEYACKYEQIKNGSLDQELKGFLYLSKLTKQKLRRENDNSSYDVNVPEVNPYAPIIPYDNKDVRQFVIKLVDKWPLFEIK